MKIGILGSPGAGKTKFAHELASYLAHGDFDHFHIIDEYIYDLRLNTGLEYGEFGNFVDDMQVVFKRREWELAWTDKNTITCGTVLDSVIHNFVRTEPAARTRREIGLQTERLKVIAASFGLLYTETWDYDYAFLLQTDDDMGKALVDLLTTYCAPVLTFNPKISDDEKARIAYDAIIALEKNATSQVEKSGVRGSGETSPSERDSVDDVSDVPE